MKRRLTIVIEQDTQTAFQPTVVALLGHFLAVNARGLCFGHGGGPEADGKIKGTDGATLTWKHEP